MRDLDRSKKQEGKVVNEVSVLVSRLFVCVRLQLQEPSQQVEDMDRDEDNSC